MIDFQSINGRGSGTVTVTGQTTAARADMDDRGVDDRDDPGPRLYHESHPNAD